LRKSSSSGLPAVTIGSGSILDHNAEIRRTRPSSSHLRILEQGRPTERIERHLLAARFAHDARALRARAAWMVVAESLQNSSRTGGPFGSGLRATRHSTSGVDALRPI
jgi:hypothetical protein